MSDTIPIYPYMSHEGLIQLVPLKNYEQLKDAVAELNQRLQDRTQDYLKTMQELRADSRDLVKLIRRLHRAIAARMSADEPTGQERLELLHAWEEAGKVLDGFASLVRPNDADRGQCADKATFQLAPGEG